MKPSEEFLIKRRSIVKEIDGIKTVRTTFSVKIKLEKSPLLTETPFLIHQYSARIEAMEFSYQNLQCKPSMVYHESLFQEGCMYEYFRVREARMEIFDAAPSVRFISPFPSVEIEGKKEICQGFTIHFFGNEGSIKKWFVVYYLPFIVIVFLNWVHVLSADESDAGNYIENSSSIALAFVFCCH